MPVFLTGVAELKLIEKHKKILGAIYEYKAVHRFSNEDDCAGQIKISFREMSVEILSLADGDFCKTNVFAEVAIRRILQIPFKELPKKLTIPFELEMEREYVTVADRCGGFYIPFAPSFGTKQILPPHSFKIFYANYTRTAGFCSCSILRLLLAM